MLKTQLIIIITHCCSALLYGSEFGYSKQEIAAILSSLSLFPRTVVRTKISDKFITKHVNLRVSAKSVRYGM